MTDLARDDAHSHDPTSSRGSTAAGSALDEARAFVRRARTLLSAPTSLRERAREQYAELKRRVSDEEMWNVPVERLRVTTSKPLRLELVRDSGIRTLTELLREGERGLLDIHGIGTTTAERLMRSATEVASAIRDGAAFRFEVERRDDRQTEFLRSLLKLHVADRAHAELAESARRRCEHVERELDRVAENGTGTTALREGLSDPIAETVRASTDELVALDASDKPLLWREFEHNEAICTALLAEIAGPGHPDGPDGVPAEIAREVDAVDLDIGLLRVTPHDYQVFGAKFAVARERALLGDEHGLDKALQAVAAMAHLRSRGRQHFLVVAPGEELAGWRRQIERRSALTAIDLHGPNLEIGAQRWMKHGGVGITDFDTAPDLPLLRLTPLLGHTRPHLLVVDEAQHIGAPSTQVSAAVATLTGPAERALFLSGLRMDERPEQFRDIVAHLQPRVAERIACTAGRGFHLIAAPVYLRRSRRRVRGR